MANRKEPAKVWIDGDLIKIKPVNSDNIHFLDFTPELYEKVVGVRWSELHNGYLVGYINRKNILIHHLVLPKNEKIHVDHINRNKCDHTKNNLRYLNRHQSGINRNKQTSNTSGYIGVTYHKHRNKWYSQIRVDGKRKYLGYFKTPEEASEAYQEALKKYYPNIYYDEAK